MALKLQKYLNPCGIEVEEGYFEIYELIYNLDYNNLGVRGRIYLSKEARDGGFRPIDSFETVIELDKAPEGNLVEFAYNHILEIASKGLEYIQENCPLYKGFIGAEVI